MPKIGAQDVGTHSAVGIASTYWIFPQFTALEPGFIMPPSVPAVGPPLKAGPPIRRYVMMIRVLT
jgi:hypothetical protein